MTKASLLTGTLVGLLLTSSFISAETMVPDTATMRNWVREMKGSPRGPFKRIRWFCKDGTVHPPKPYPCGDRGGGVQHGEWNDRVKTLRDNGYYIANVLADIEAEEFLQDPEHDKALKQILLEQFLITADDGWIFRGAHYYRGALQVEDEMRSGQDLLLALLNEPDWRGRRFTVLRETVRLLPHGRSGAPLTEIRQLSRTIGEKDAGFEELRTKIHVKPDANDAQLVREYGARNGLPALAQEYEDLAAAIDQVYRQQETGAELASLVDRVKDPGLANTLGRNTARLSKNEDPAIRLAAAGHSLAAIRSDLSHVGDLELMLALLEAGLELEREFFRSGSLLLEHLDETSRRERLLWLRSSTDALYGIGLISPRQWNALGQSLSRLNRSPISVSTYKTELDYLSRVSEWADQKLRFYFSESVEHLTALEPLTRRYVHDRLHGSPLLFHTAVVDSLLEDSNRLVGVSHEVFGEATAGGLRGLNPGLARGILRFSGSDPGSEAFDRGGIYVLPATTDELPPVAGIMTAGEGNSLSHVQLLARNLGIPNVVVKRELLHKLEGREGQRVVLAVSPRGVVHIAEDSPRWDSVFTQEAGPPDRLIRPDLRKLDLKTRDVILLDDLRASDSGRIAGPKAANLGELKNRFPEAVADGLVIPFGVFRTILDKPIEPGGPPMFRWMQQQYKHLEDLKDDPEAYSRATRRFLARVRNWILRADPGPDFRTHLRTEMARVFGVEGTYGVFVRSDTNVEDLPGFTGAGLNLTVPNVVGFGSVMEAIVRVWASPFEERAYAWRQAHMEQPEHVYVSVLLMRSVPVEKSGVMVTVDLESGHPGWISVAANRGIGGAVAGQQAEELRVNVETHEVRVMAEATEPRRRVLLPDGGIAKIPADSTDSVLEKEEIGRLIELTRTLPDRFPLPRDRGGQPVPADIEFGFYKGRLFLFQIRPFLESSRARQSRFLNGLDRRLDTGRVSSIDLDQIPLEG